jgi:hypothetical protein
MPLNEKGVNGILDELIDQINSTFLELLAASTMYNLGQYTIDQVKDDAVVSPKVGTDLYIEPIPMTEIKSFKNNYPHFLSEAFHGKLVHLWNSCLNDIFSLFVDLHLLGVRKLEELKKQDVKLDFSSSNDLSLQIKERIIAGFRFWEYSERQKLINKILNPTNKKKKELANIYKNILVRNVIQHRNCIVDPYILNKLGIDKIDIIDIDGKPMVYRENDKILLSIPEVHLFKQSMLTICQIWRMKDD